MKSINNTRSKSGFVKSVQCLGLVFSLLGVLILTSISTQATADSAIRTGFDFNTLAANDDGSTGLVPLGFDINFFGSGFNETYVNNNGNITFDGPMGTFTPFTITDNTRKIIAPFFADVDTAVSGSNPVTYGQGLVGTRPAFGVNWINVACFATTGGGYNTFQMVLIDRSDIGAGDFDIEFNYGQIVWETGQASGGDAICQGGTPVHIGYSSGPNAATGGSFELAGSGVAGYFLDSLADGITANPTGLIYNNRNSLQPGRYLFEVRNGNAPIGHSVSGTIFANDTSNPLGSSLVQVCTTPNPPTHPDTFCSLTTSNVNGEYNIGGLSDGEYDVKAFPPAGTGFQTASIHTTIAGADLPGQDIILVGPQPLPAGTSVEPALNTTSTGEVVVYWNNDLRLSTQGCQGGTASYQITRDSDGSLIRSGSLAESLSAPGSYSTIVPALYPTSGHVTVTITINCPNGSTEQVEFSMYIDPSGVVKDTNGNPVENATVTLFRSDSEIGPFTQVPDGDAIMSPTNRTNPDSTDAQGLFGWDVIAGFYKVRAEKQGCTAPAPNQAESFVETPVLTIPPPVTDLELVLDCGAPVFAVCDVNQDGAVSRSDILIINSRLRSVVTPGTSGDINGDGRISGVDSRGCVLQCTLPNCAEPAP